MLELGDWTVEENRRGGPLQHVQCGDYTICHDVISPDIAHLIAAAPELYAALVNMVELWNSASSDPGDDIDRARSALSKARGDAT